jgi:oligopeptidase A
MFALVRSLFGIIVEAADGQAPVWHQDVRFFKIYAEDRTHLASFYLDPFSRPQDKRSGAWMDDCRSRYRDASGTLNLPVAHLVCNMTPPVGDAPSLLTFNEVETLFHEFGHGLQHMLTEVDYLDVSGINGVEWDAVELPSQFMENWCYHKPTLMGMARHSQSGEQLPDELFAKLNAAKTFRAGQMMLRQLQFAMLDLRLHQTFDPSPNGKQSPFALQAEVAKTTSLLPPLPEDRFLCSFSHIFCGGYAAGYYSYKWAEVLSADAFNAFEEAGLDRPEVVSSVGKRFRQTILALGGSVHPLSVFTAFRGREPRIEPLLLHSGLRDEGLVAGEVQ